MRQRTGKCKNATDSDLTIQKAAVSETRKKSCEIHLSTEIFPENLCARVYSVVHLVATQGTATKKIFHDWAANKSPIFEATLAWCSPGTKPPICITKHKQQPDVARLRFKLLHLTSSLEAASGFGERCSCSQTWGKHMLGAMAGSGADPQCREWKFKDELSTAWIMDAATVWILNTEQQNMKVVELETYCAGWWNPLKGQIHSGINCPF